MRAPDGSVRESEAAGAYDRGFVRGRSRAVPLFFMKMKKRLSFLFAVFGATLLLMALQKPIFLARYAPAGTGIAAWLQVVWHGLSLDATVAGYVTALPLVATLVSLWVAVPACTWRRIFRCYFTVVSVVSALVFAVDIALYEHWGFRIDGTVLIYLADPKDAMANVDGWLAVRQLLFCALVAAAMIGVYFRVVGLFDGGRVRLRGVWSGVLLLLAGFDFLAIRGGTGASVANVSKVCFSTDMLLNHAAVNPLFSFLSTLGPEENFAEAYPFFDEPTRAARFERLRGNTGREEATLPVLRRRRPNIALVILESFGSTVMEAETEGQPVMPHMQRLKHKGVWFENFYANSFRTDRGEVAILSGFPAQTKVSIMKMPAKCAGLPSLARSLGREGYSSFFVYGGDLNFTNQSSYMYATGWQELIWQKELRFDAAPSKWGYDDAVMCDYFADEVIARSASSEVPFLGGLLTLSSHIPFDVPYAKFADEVLNAMAFSDECVGRMVERLKASPAWDDLLLILVADHGYPYPYGIAYNIPERHRIPMIWLGGAVDGARSVAEYGSQIDLCATLLAQLGVSHDEFDYSRNLLDTLDPPRRFAYYTFNEGFGAIDATGEAVWDAASGRTLGDADPELLDAGRTMLQTTYVDLDRR